MELIIIGSFDKQKVLVRKSSPLMLVFAYFCWLSLLNLKIKIYFFKIQLKQNQGSQFQGVRIRSNFRAQHITTESVTKNNNKVTKNI